MRTLRPSQIPMVEHIVKHPRCAIFAGVGVGKTASVIAALSDLSATEQVFPALVCAPLRVARDTWRDEVVRWEQYKHIKIVSVVGTPKERLAALAKKADIYCTNYENIPWLVEHFNDGKKWPYKTVIADESTKLRGFRLRQGTARSKALARVAHNMTNRFINLTGTPTPKGLENLWGPTWFLDKGERLGRSFDAFRSRWFTQGYDGFSWRPVECAQREIQDRIRDICLSVDVKDYFDIKEPIVNNIYVELQPAARKIYEEMEKRMFVELAEASVEAFNAASRTGKCLQIANGSLYTDDKRSYQEIHNSKLDALDDIVEESNGMPIMVAYNFVSDKERLMKRFPNALDLSTEKGLAAFKAGRSPMGIAHPASLGHGIDGLQNVTNIIVHFGHNWDLELYDQINGRIGPVRQMQAGLDRPVFIHHIIAKDTVDEMVVERRETKRSVQDILLAAMKRKKLLPLRQLLV